MYKIFIVWCYLIISSVGYAKQNLSTITAPGNFDNIHVQPLGSDQYASESIVFVRKQIAAHYHAEHTELVYILAGTGIMQLGDEKSKNSAGDFIFITQGVVHSVQVTSDIPLKVLSIQTPEFKGKDRVFIK